MRVVVMGNGYVGSRLAILLAREATTEVWTLRRQPQTTDSHSLAGDITRTDAFVLPPALTHVVFCVGLKGALESAYESLFITGIRNVLERLQDHPIERVLFTSTTGVYAETTGRWVTEDSPVRPLRMSTRYHLAAEQQVLESTFPAVVARLSGIYGPGRTRMIEAVDRDKGAAGGDASRIVNQIHRDDAAGALYHLLTQPSLSEVMYNVTDTEPVERGALLDWLARQTGQAVSPVSPAAQRSPSRRAGNKRVSCQRLLDSGFRHRFPSYREGYGALLTASESQSL